MKVIGIITVSLFTIIVGTILSGYTLSVLWEWFVVTTFGVKPLTIPAAIGLSAIVSYTTHQHKQDDNKDKSYTETIIFAMLFSIMKPAMALAFGYIVKSFM